MPSVFPCSDLDPAMPLTPHEKMQLQALLAKANDHSVESPTSEAASFDFVTEDGFEGGSMTDASKRRDDLQNEAQPPSKRVTPQSLAGYASAASETPWIGGSDVTTKHSEPPVGKIPKAVYPVDLPPNVASHEEWGRTLVEFGKYEGANMSYRDLWFSKDPNVSSYVKWCRSRAFSAEGHLRDLALYFMYMTRLQSDFQDGPLIPGTKAKRHFK